MIELDWFTVRGLKSLAEVNEIPVRCPTIITGANDGGKSTTLRAVSFLLGKWMPSAEDYTKLGPPLEGTESLVLAGACWADEDGESLRAGDRMERGVLLGAEGRGDPLRDFTHRAFSRSLAGVSARGLCECGGASLDRLLLCADGERRHSSVLEGEDASVADHLAGDPECCVGEHLSGCLLERDGTQLARVKHGAVLGQLSLDAILNLAAATRALGTAEEP